jgi:enoyl-CoA hydratase
MGKWFHGHEHIVLDVRDAGVAYVTLNRPEKRNAITADMLDALRAAMMEADDLTSVRCVVLQGAGGNFSAGADIAGGDIPGDFDPSKYRAGSGVEDDIWRTTLRGDTRQILFKMHKPVIAKLRGNCLAAATDIALTCDLLIASNDARIGFPATRALGSPANHMWLYHVGPQWAKRLLMTGDVIRGKDAARIGLVLKSVPDARLDDEVEALARRIALVDPALTAAHKRIVNLGLELMGTATLQRLASENDVRAHQSPAMAEFMEVARVEGLKEALRRRDEPFGDGEVHFDD